MLQVDLNHSQNHHPEFVLEIPMTIINSSSSAHSSSSTSRALPTSACPSCPISPSPRRPGSCHCSTPFIQSVSVECISRLEDDKNAVTSYQDSYWWYLLFVWTAVACLAGWEISISRPLIYSWRDSKTCFCSGPSRNDHLHSWLSPGALQYVTKDGLPKGVGWKHSRGVWHYANRQ